MGSLKKINYKTTTNKCGGGKLFVTIERNNRITVVVIYKKWFRQESSMHCKNIGESAENRLLTFLKISTYSMFIIKSKITIIEKEPSN